MVPINGTWDKYSLPPGPTSQKCHMLVTKAQWPFSGLGGPNHNSARRGQWRSCVRTDTKGILSESVREGKVTHGRGWILEKHLWLDEPTVHLPVFRPSSRCFACTYSHSLRSRFSQSSRLSIRFRELHLFEDYITASPMFYNSFTYIVLTITSLNHVSTSLNLLWDDKIHNFFFISSALHEKNFSINVYKVGNPKKQDWGGDSIGETLAMQPRGP